MTELDVDLAMAPDERFVGPPIWLLSLAGALGAAAVGASFVAGFGPRAVGFGLGALAVVTGALFKARQRSLSEGDDYAEPRFLRRAVTVVTVVALLGLGLNVWPVAKKINDVMGTCACITLPGTVGPSDG